MRIAIVGSGVSGLVAAWMLCDRHDVVLFEAADKLGGHVSTTDLVVAGQQVSVDTGFIVYNRRNYPGFSSMLDALGAETRPTTMSFSVSCAETGIEYAGHDLNGLFAQRRNALNPRFVRMISQILRFNRSALEDVGAVDWEVSIGDYLDRAGFDGLFRSHYLLPMAAAIWSSPIASVARMPARLFIDFFHNHGLLTLRDRPQWRTLVGGSSRYVEILSAGFRDQIRLGCPVRFVQRSAQSVKVGSPAGVEHFDQIIFACHADQALGALYDADTRERDILSALPFESNAATLHADTSLLPKSRRAWAAWNYSLDRGTTQRARVTYNLNLLQGLDCSKTICVTLNDAERIPEDKVYGQYLYEHPIYDTSGQAARARRWEISGHNRTWYCGAYWGCGFHEDGFQSSAEVAERLNAEGRAAA